ncbi:hypothetical protein CcaCcLH18_07888 [Colletotrichum camelliae]|nr:hypothetical protein CcaCcLH18_07888 [Colletotrichum camelliae]
MKPDLRLLVRINQVAIGEVHRTAPHSIRLVDPVNLAPGMPFSTQHQVAKAILARFEYEDVNPAKTPMASHEELPMTWDPKECTEEESIVYIKETVCFNYLTTGTRPDMAYAVGELSQANAGPSKAHLRAMKHLFRYLKGIVYYGIIFGSPDSMIDLSLYATADSSCADNKPSLAWKSNKQTFVTLRSTEAEYINLTPAAVTVKWLRRVVEQLLDQKIPTPTILFTDSANAYANVMNPLNEARTRHIDLRYKWIIQEAIRDKTITIRQIRGNEMPADGLTKSLGPHKRAEFVRMLGLVEGLD